MRLSLLHPSRGRPEKSFDTVNNWIDKAGRKIEVIISLDEDDPELINYCRLFAGREYAGCRYYAHSNKSAIDAINLAAASALGDVFIVVSDDTECFNSWAIYIEEETEGKHDFILKTQDGIQKYIITNPIMDRAYYNRFGYIYHPDFQHLFCDTWLTVMADITGRKIISDLMFRHNHYSVNGTPPDELHKRNDATWRQGEETFIKLLKTLSPEDLKKIEDPSMRNWIRNKGIRV